MSIERKIMERQKQVMALANAKVRHAAVSLLSKVQLKSPVDTGAFRQAWTLTEKDPFHFVVSNDKPYALVLEYGYIIRHNKVKGSFPLYPKPIEPANKVILYKAHVRKI